ncbi:hypothetical protein [Facklamia miroungae]|uniref:Uncharacterized protein n=1 Tax=Facklamia miroungae TaxID=120956 RepID=A0A1G7T0J6_9LACT|nr:hypothetical protein [Facklamia miroungae]NKZ29461.1 hypothetical protein [Facklamia miroungae]SDG28751.1 hypothetical protein SAMN05421791_104236 [Facklamia miroungae]
MTRKERIIFYLIIATLSVIFMLRTTVAYSESETFVPQPALPSELEKVKKSANERDDGAKNSKNTQSPQTNREKGLFETNIVVYSLNEFDNLESLEDFSEYVKNDAILNDQVSLENVSKDNRYLLEATYKESAEKERQLIVFYVSAAIEGQDQAQKALEHNLFLYPDLLVKGELVPQNGKYDLAYGLNIHSNSDAFDINYDTKEIVYDAQREPFVYEIESGEDPYKSAIEERFPGQFKFESKTVAGKTQVTLSEIPLNESEKFQTREISSINNDGSLWSQIKSKVNNFFDQIQIKEKLINLGISDQNITIMTIVLAGVLVAIGIILIVRGIRRH